MGRFRGQMNIEMENAIVSMGRHPTLKVNSKMTQTWPWLTPPASFLHLLYLASIQFLAISRLVEFSFLFFVCDTNRKAARAAAAAAAARDSADNETLPHCRHQLRVIEGTCVDTLFRSHQVNPVVGIFVASSLIDV